MCVKGGGGYLIESMIVSDWTICHSGRARGASGAVCGEANEGPHMGEL